MSLKDLWESDFLLMAFGIVFACVFVTFIVMGVRAESKISKMPIQARKAKVVSSRYMNAFGTNVLFEFEDGSRQNFTIKVAVAATITVNDVGTLTSQGGKFLRFERGIADDQTS